MLHRQLSAAVTM